jgi:hypothetical protein
MKSKQIKVIHYFVSNDYRYKDHLFGTIKLGQNKLALGHFNPFTKFYGTQSFVFFEQTTKIGLI